MNKTEFSLELNRSSFPPGLQTAIDWSLQAVGRKLDEVKSMLMGLCGEDKVQYDRYVFAMGAIMFAHSLEALNVTPGSPQAAEMYEAAQTFYTEHCTTVEAREKLIERKLHEMIGELTGSVSAPRKNEN